MSAVDLSRWQGVIPSPVFAQWRAAGVTLIILKVGGSDSGSRYRDSTFSPNLGNATAAGLPVDGYWFNGTTDPAGDVQYAHNIVPAGMRIWLDVESEGAMPHWTPAQLEAAAKEAQALAHPVGVYMSSSVTYAADWSSCAWIPLWVANYSSKSPPAVKYFTEVMWQFTSTAHLPGYGGNLDESEILTAAAGGNPTPLTEVDMQADERQWLQDLHDAIFNGGPSMPDAARSVGASLHALDDQLTQIVRMLPVIQDVHDAIFGPVAPSLPDAERPLGLSVKILNDLLTQVHGTVTQPVVRDGAPVSQAADNAATGTLVRKLATTGVPAAASVTVSDVTAAVTAGLSTLKLAATS